MSNILRVTTPVTGYDNPNQVKTGPSTLPDPKIQGQVIPDKVTRTDARSDSASQEQNIGLKFLYNSNFESFIQQMKNSPMLAEEFPTLLYEAFATMATSGMEGGFAEQIAKFMSMIQISSPQEMLALLKGQGDSSIRYNGAFFSLIRQALAETTSVELKAGILDFMKRYTDWAEGRHIMANIQQNLQEIKDRMMSGARGQLEEMSKDLRFGDQLQRGDTSQNAGTIKDRILPFLNDYITQTHDRGGLREAAALLGALTARYENGDSSRLKDAFEQLLKYQGMQKYFGGGNVDGLFNILNNTEFERASDRNLWAKQFAAMIESGMKGEAGTENRQVFQNLMQSILLNESVYMPVLHMMLPAQFEDRMMFAEMWIDPDAGQKNGNGGEQERLIQGLIKFDIQEVGFFDLYFLYGEGKVNIQLNYPEQLREKESDIRNSIGRILAENGLESQELILENSKISIPLSEAFPKIYERKNSVNVTV